MDWVSTEGLDNAEVLAALYAAAACDAYASKADPDTITVAEAQKLLETRPEVGVLHHRLIGVHFGPDGFDATQYDANRGRGAAQRVVDGLRTTTAKAA